MEAKTRQPDGAGHQGDVQAARRQQRHAVARRTGSVRRRERHDVQPPLA
jgi:hypothetical protein